MMTQKKAMRRKIAKAESFSTDRKYIGLLANVNFTSIGKAKPNEQLMLMNSSGSKGFFSQSKL